MHHQFAAPVLLVLAGLWLAYLVPDRLRHRQQLLESRVDDRFSEALRVVKVTERGPTRRGRRAERTRRAAGRAHAGTTGLLTPGKGLPARAGGRTGGETVDRPHATPERVTAEAARRAAQARAARAAASARRAAGARRRAALFAVLVVATAVGWSAVGVGTGVPMLVGLIPTVLLVAVLAAGRSAVVSGRRHDEALAAQIATAEEVVANPRSGATRTVAAARAKPAAATSTAAPSAPAAKQTVAAAVSTPAAAEPSVPVALVTGRAVRPSDDQTEVFEVIVADRGEKGAAARHASSGQVAAVRRDATPTQGIEAVAAGPAAPPVAEPDESWEPVPVPRPTYAMKPAAPRREPVPLGEVEASTAVRPADADEAPHAVEESPNTPAAPVETSSSIDLNAVLAKRRAAGQ